MINSPPWQIAGNGGKTALRFARARFQIEIASAQADGDRLRGDGIVHAIGLFSETRGSGDRRLAENDPDDSEGAGAGSGGS